MVRVIGYWIIELRVHQDRKVFMVDQKPRHDRTEFFCLKPNQKHGPRVPPYRLIVPTAEFKISRAIRNVESLLDLTAKSKGAFLILNVAIDVSMKYIRRCSFAFLPYHLILQYRFQ